jgi:hypothetical protein
MGLVCEARRVSVFTSEDISVMLGVLANSHCLGRLNHMLMKRDEEKVLCSLMLCLRVLNLGWRIWGWAERERIDKPFALSQEGGIGVALFQKDAVVFAEAMRTLHC